VKKDLVIAIIAILVVAGVCFGLAAVRPPFQPLPSHPFSMAAVGPSVSGHIVMRINGEPVTEEEFIAALQAVPEQLQPQYSSESGKGLFAEQLIRLKLLEQEARRLGVDNEPRVEGQVAWQRDQTLANAAAEKIVAQPSEAAIKQFYAENKGRFEMIDVSHILISYAGGAVPPRDGGAAPPETEAMNKALKVYDDLVKGADFATEARKYSDDVQSANNGGELGQLAPGQLPKELEARVFHIPVGRFSGPIPSQYGIHIFKINARGTVPFDKIKTALAQRVRQRDLDNRLEGLRRAAKVDFDQKFFPDLKNFPNVTGRKPS
jgi:parvulin-like peptidyl-prolyl isomerase